MAKTIIRLAGIRVSRPTFSTFIMDHSGYTQQSDEQGGWGESDNMGYPGDVSYTGYSVPGFASNAGGYGYPPGPSDRHPEAPSGPFVPPSTCAPQPWDMSQYQPISWADVPTTTYAMASGNIGNNLLMDNPILASGFLDTSSLLDSLPLNNQQPVDNDDNYDPPSPPRPRGSPPSPFSCNECGETFANQKNWDRHLLSEKHISNVQEDTNVPKYKCACNYVQARKDNYRRHLKHCGFRIDFAYVCSCGDWTQDKAYHENHIDLCGRKRRGRGHK